MGVSGRYSVVAAFALLALPGLAHAGCCVGGAGPVRAPVFQPAPASIVPGPAAIAPAAPVTQRPQAPTPSAHGCCAAGVVIASVALPAPSLVVHQGGATHVNVITNGVVQSGPSYSTFVTRVAVGGGGVMMGGASLDAGGQTGPLQVSGGEIRLSEARSRQTLQTAAVRAVCMDDKGNPHPASQVFGGADVDPAYAGELFRCMAGTAMQVTVGKLAEGKPVFDGGDTFGCAKGEALAREGDGLVCRTQLAKRPCNERSLLRRYGPGVKFVRTMITERQQAETIRREATVTGSMALDGGVGGGLY